MDLNRLFTIFAPAVPTALSNSISANLLPAIIQICRINTHMKNIKDNPMKRYERTMTYNEFVKSDLCKRMIKEEHRLLAERDKHETLRQNY